MPAPCLAFLEPHYPLIPIPHLRTNYLQQGQGACLQAKHETSICAGACNSSRAFSQGTHMLAAWVHLEVKSRMRQYWLPVDCKIHRSPVQFQVVHIRIYSGCCHQLQSTSRLEATYGSFTAKSCIRQYWLPVDCKIHRFGYQHSPQGSHRTGSGTASRRPHPGRPQ